MLNDIYTGQHCATVKVKRLHADAVIPTYVHVGDSGFDLVAVEDVVVEPGQTVKVPTGLSFQIPLGYEMQIRPRSGVTSKTKLRVQLGTVDSSYRGEVSVIVDNINTPVTVVDRLTHHLAMERRHTIPRGYRIAQAVICPVVHAELVEVDELDETSRGTGGFGSTDV